MSRGNTANSKDVYKLPEDITDEVIDTPDILRARAFDPRAEFDIMNRTVGARLSDEIGAANEDYGAYTGMPSAVARNHARDMRVGAAHQGERLAIGAGAQAANATQGDYLQNMARLTATRRRRGFTSTLKGAQGGGVGSSLIGAGAALGAAAIGARYPSRST